MSREAARANARGPRRWRYAPGASRSLAERATMRRDKHNATSHRREHENRLKELHGRGLTSDVAHDKTWSSRHCAARVFNVQFSVGQGIPTQSHSRLHRESAKGRKRERGRGISAGRKATPTAGMEQEGAEKTEARQILCYLCGLLFNSGSRFSAPRVAVSPRRRISATKAPRSASLPRAASVARPACGSGWPRGRSPGPRIRWRECRRA